MFQWWIEKTYLPKVASFTILMAYYVLCASLCWDLLHWLEHCCLITVPSSFRFSSCLSWRWKISSGRERTGRLWTRKMRALNFVRRILIRSFRDAHRPSQSSLRGRDQLLPRYTHRYTLPLMLESMIFFYVLKVVLWCLPRRHVLIKVH